jgi:hypothetical protein
MPEGPLHQPHDKLFKLGFSDAATAAAFLREQIPDPVSEAVEWEGIELLPSSLRRFLSTPSAAPRLEWWCCGR